MIWPRGAVELVGKEAVATGEAFGQGAGAVGEVNGLLLDVQLLEHEGHGRTPFSERGVGDQGEQMNGSERPAMTNERGAADQATAGERLLINASPSGPLSLSCPPVRLLTSHLLYHFSLKREVVGATGARLNRAPRSSRPSWACSWERQNYSFQCYSTLWQFPHEVAQAGSFHRLIRLMSLAHL